MRVHLDDVARMDSGAVNPADGADAAVARGQRKARVKDFDDKPSQPISAIRAAVKFDLLRHATAFSASVG
jgi:hypothetical protein